MGKGHCSCNGPLMSVAFLSFISVYSPLASVSFLQLAKNLPPRTIGYPWTLAYGTTKHGMSIKSLYRAMQGQDTPVLLVIRDSDGGVSGTTTLLLGLSPDLLQPLSCNRLPWFRTVCFLTRCVLVGCVAAGVWCVGVRTLQNQRGILWHGRDLPLHLLSRV